MNPRRFSLASLMCVVAVLALMLFAVRHPTPLMASIAFAFTVFVLLVVLVRGLACLTAKRAVYLAFGVFGLAYLVIWFHEDGPPTLVTQGGIEYVMYLLERATPSGAAADDPFAAAMRSNRSILVRLPPGPGVNTVCFRQIAHCLLSLLFGSLGAMVGKLFVVREGRTASR